MLSSLSRICLSRFGGGGSSRGGRALSPSFANKWGRLGRSGQGGVWEVSLLMSGRHYWVEGNLGVGGGGLLYMIIGDWRGERRTLSMRKSGETDPTNMNRGMKVGENVYLQFPMRKKPRTRKKEKKQPKTPRTKTPNRPPRFSLVATSLDKIMKFVGIKKRGFP